jgi:hypothetical protein
MIINEVLNLYILNKSFTEFYQNDLPATIPSIQPTMPSFDTTGTFAIIYYPNINTHNEPTLIQTLTFNDIQLSLIPSTQTQIFKLRLFSNNRIDHPNGGSKDMADALAGSVFASASNIMVDNYRHNWPPYQILNH